MAVNTNLLFNNNAAQAQTQTAPAQTAPKGNQEPEAFAWVNVGIALPDGTFLSLMGLPWSSIISRKGLSKTQQSYLMKLRNKLETITPGETGALNMVVEGRRIDPNPSELSTDIDWEF